MIVAVCTQNNNIKKMIQEKDDIIILFSEDIDIEIQEYDLVIVDVALCRGKLDVAKMQSRRTVFAITEITEENLYNVIYNFRIGVHPFRYAFNGIEHTIDLNDILYFESDHREIRAHFENGESVRFYSKLDDVQERVDDYVFFVRINKSCLVNYNYATIQKYDVIVAGQRFCVSRTYQKEFEKRMSIIENMYICTNKCKFVQIY